MKQRNHTALLFAAILSIATVAAAQNPTEPPASQHAMLEATGKGVQIYACQQSGGAAQWVFQAPEATLLNATGEPIGTHAAGPIWRSNDGSTVKGELLKKAASPDPTAIPWLLLKASVHTGTGVMSKVEFIRRSNTTGGIAPASGCDDQHLNAVARIPYTAAYTFYSPIPETKP